MNPPEVVKEVASIPVRVWRWSGQQKTSYRTATVVFVLLGWLFIVVRDNDQEAHQRDAAFALYQAEVSQYENDYDKWETCLGAAVNRDNNRENWHALYDAFIKAGADEVLVQALRTDFDERTPPMRIGDCGSQPQPPIPPEGVIP